MYHKLAYLGSRIKYAINSFFITHVPVAAYIAIQMLPHKGCSTACSILCTNNGIKRLVIYLDSLACVHGLNQLLCDNNSDWFAHVPYGIYSQWVMRWFGHWPTVFIVYKPATRYSSYTSI